MGQGAASLYESVMVARRCSTPTGGLARIEIVAGGDHTQRVPVGGPLQAGRCGRVVDFCGQATKGVWGMSWRQKAMKGVEVCDNPGGIDKRVVIPGYPNERTLNP